MDDLTKQIGRRMRAARKAKGMTQSEISQRTNLDQAYISRLENGTAEGSPAQILGIARAIGVPIAQIYNDQEAMAKKVADLSDEAIEIARLWQALPADQRAAMRAAVESLNEQATR
ncbi:MAG: helix-turn-helix domain-containing protein [Candidatus Thiodiazotropha endolucinida]|nr:helix-turn-helix domain-containing protein [Candidatus Thiodiazotropha endolucinida]